MFRPEKPETANFHTKCATLPDFRDALEQDMKGFYLLASLLTANHKEAGQCFASTLLESCKENSVFKAWTGSWIKRCLIMKAIHIVFVFSGSTRSEGIRNLWSEGPGEAPINNVVNALTSLDGLERFVFVMSFLEGYPSRECSLLLKCTAESVVELRTRASCTRAGSDPFSTAFSFKVRSRKQGTTGKNAGSLTGRFLLGEPRGQSLTYCV
jgi:hypothetical protein